MPNTSFSVETLNSTSAGVTPIESNSTVVIFNGTTLRVPDNFGGFVDMPPAKFTYGISGSLTKLTDGTSYLIAGSNTTIISQSNGAITIAALSGGMTADLPFNGFKATGLGAPTGSGDAARWDEVASTTGKTWYVNATSSAGGNGSFTRQFQTVQAGLNAASSGDHVVVGPGTYAEAITWPNTDNVFLEGAGASITKITGSATPGTHTLQWIPPTSSSFERMTVKDLTLACTNSGGQCLYLDGDATVVSLFAQFLKKLSVFENVLLDKSGSGDAAFVRAANAVEVRSGEGLYDPNASEVVGWNGNIKLRNVGLFVIRNTPVGEFGGLGLDVQYDNTAVARPFAGRQGVYLIDNSVVHGSVTFSKHPIFITDATTQIIGNVTDSGLTTYTSGPAHAPLLVFAGAVGTLSIATSVSLSLPPIAGAGAAIPYLALAGAFTGPVLISSTGAGTGLFTRNYVDGRNGRFQATTAASLVVGASTDLDIRGGFYTQSFLSASGGGAIDRDIHTVTANVPSTPFIVTASISPPFPPGGTFAYLTVPSYHVTYELATPATYPGTSGKGASSFVATGTAAVNTTARIHRTR